jgi:hypothetical protein
LYKEGRLSRLAPFFKEVAFMRRILLVLAAAGLTAAVMAVSAAPAMARDRHHDDFGDGFRFNGVSQGVDQDTQSGDVSQNFSVRNSGNYAMQCTPASQFANTGNFNNAPSFLQFGSLADDFKSGGIEFVAAPVVTTDCAQQVQQSSTAFGQ